MLKKGEVQAPGQSGCGELTAWIVVAVIAVSSLGIWGFTELVG